MGTLCIAYVIVFFILFYFMISVDNMPAQAVWLKLGEGLVNTFGAALILLSNFSLLTALIRLSLKSI